MLMPSDVSPSYSFPNRPSHKSASSFHTPQHHITASPKHLLTRSSTGYWLESPLTDQGVEAGLSPAPSTYPPRKDRLRSHLTSRLLDLDLCPHRGDELAPLLIPPPIARLVHSPPHPLHSTTTSLPTAMLDNTRQLPLLPVHTNTSSHPDGARYTAKQIAQPALSHRQLAPAPKAGNGEHQCKCTHPGCKCKVMTTSNVCSLVSAARIEVSHPIHTYWVLRPRDDCSSLSCLAPPSTPSH
jgi:hypothetical protein